MLTDPETKILREQAREITSKLKTVKADFANYRAMAEEKHTQDEIEKDDLRTRLAAAKSMGATWDAESTR